MATLSAALRNDKADAVGVLDRLELLDGATVLATVEIDFSAASGGVITASPDPVSATGTGVADGGRLFHSTDGTREVTGLVVGTHITLDNPNIATDQSVSITSVTYTVPATVNAGS